MAISWDGMKPIVITFQHTGCEELQGAIIDILSGSTCKTCICATGET
ncbi:MAG: hypothetical protein ACXV5P_08660 [Halobacteriota archaeon]